MTTPEPDRQPDWLAALVNSPRHIAQPFSLSAVALIAAVVLGIFGPLVASLSCIGISVALLAVGILRSPKPEPLQGDSYTSVAGPDSRRTAIPHGLSELDAICFRNLYQREDGAVGRNQRFPIRYFVDLMTASLEGHLDVMVRELATHMRNSRELDGITTIASPKRGNSLLLAGVAKELGLAPVFVKERALYGKMLEGVGGNPKRAAIVDDISSDGELLVTCVKVLQENGYDVRTAFVLIDRIEGDAIAALAKVGVSLVPLVRYGDSELASIAERGRRAS